MRNILENMLLTLLQHMQVWNSHNFTNYKHFSDIGGTIYGNGLPKGDQKSKSSGNGGY